MDYLSVLNELKELVKVGEEKIIPSKWRSNHMRTPVDYVDYALYQGWHTRVLSFLKLVFDDDNAYVLAISGYDKNYLANAESTLEILISVIEYYEKGFFVIPEENKLNVDSELRRIFNRFFRIARQLRNRHDGRPTIEANDEYDVQDILHSLLTLFFDDIRAEEWTPSYAGKSSRMDFLLKKEELVIEVKKTRDGLADKDVSDQLIVDVERYKKHPDCKKLICFVYDPEGRIGNPEGIMNDLNERHKGFAEVIIEPRN